MLPLLLLLLLSESQVDARLLLQDPDATTSSSSSSATTTSTTSSPPHLTCDAEDASTQAAHFSTRPGSDSQCTPHVWLAQLQASQHRHERSILFDIGCNQGYHSAEMFDVFAPELHINKRAMLNVDRPVMPNTTSIMCPQACLEDCDTVHHTPLLVMGGRHVEVHCVEPSDVHFAHLDRARSALFDGTTLQQSSPQLLSVNRRMVSPSGGVSHGSWHLYNMAVSNASGTAFFTKLCTTEQCQLEEGTINPDDKYIVQVTTVDELLRMAGSPQHVVFMKIDTEGFDPEVLAGAQETLNNQVVKVLVFEYHSINRWATTQLRDVVTRLEAFGYACYMEGTPHIFKLSRGCWTDAYETHSWSNVVCGAGAQYELLLDAFSYLRLMQARTSAASPWMPATQHHHRAHHVAKAL